VKNPLDSRVPEGVWQARNYPRLEDKRIMNLKFLYWIILGIGACQGLVLGIILWLNESQNRKNNKYLAILLLGFSYELVVGFLYATKLVFIEHPAYYFLLDINWMYGPFLYFYISSRLYPDYYVKGKEFVHLIPVALQLIIGAFVKIQNLYWDGSRESLSWLGYQAYVLWKHTPFVLCVSSLLILFYAAYSFNMIRNFPSAMTSRRSDVLRLKRIILIYAMFAFLNLFVSCIDYLFFNFAFSPFFIYPTFIAMSAVTYGMALLGFSEISYIPASPLPKPSAAKNIRSNETQHLPKEWTALCQTLQKAMLEEKIYKDPHLTLLHLAEQLEAKPHQITQVLNRKLGKSFYDYINEFRVKESIQLMQDPAFSHYTLIAIAYESGFNSKATFNRFFKKMTGKTPNAMRSSLKYH